MNFSRHPKEDILIVDDTLDNLRFLSVMLDKQGYEVRSVTNGSTALMGAQAQPPDLILLDILMPEMNGYEVCQLLKANPVTQEIPVIFISALNEVFDKVKAFSVGGVDFITKPFQLEEVIARIENQLTIRRLQAQLLKALEQERALNQRIEEMASLEERNRIARDIHDSLGHALVALNIHMETALTLWEDDPHKAYKFLVVAKELGSEALEAVHQSVSAIKSEPLQGQSLEEAIAELAKVFHRTTGIEPECHINLSHPLSNSLKLVVYRIIQEGLTNICKYAAATAVQIHLQTTTSDLVLMLEDNGKGFRVNENRTRFGLQGMRERTTALGGQLEIASELGAGCRITATLPRLVK
ncbi:response regulator receiver sensor signal transduction histidine kinase (plasmid) [Scytonema sp. HK-05]|uniref:ATP-binding response regulator n=1 Tax=Scytonema sp. HK-05 TaxID=1137095 RepID=UPI000937C412|nr:response regulator [Scytonema sp. HK-05]OKH57071.1 histidine kinase [Scytonema sp. HK-05]BAY50268.1 response regulator receiver sensor signal transduction histidine kinase [Scytonema sp. HK-05]